MDDVFSAMSAAAALHPDPETGAGGGDDEEDGEFFFNEEEVQLGARGASLLDHLDTLLADGRDGAALEYQDGEEEEEGQFDDAEEGGAGGGSAMP